MNLLDKVGEGLTNSVDFLVEKNRQLAQLNRLSAVIRTETDVINRAYIALGKQYFKILEGTAEENDMSQICEVIKFSEERLKKAQVRYDYIKTFGIPKRTMDTAEMMRMIDIQDEEETAEEPTEETQTEPDNEPEDITIAVAEEDVTEETKTAEAPAEETASDYEAVTADNSVTVERMKKKHSRRKNHQGN